MRFQAIGFAVLILVMARAAQAQVVGPTLGHGRSVTLTLSGFWAEVDSTARVAGPLGQIGTLLDLERDLGLEESGLRFIGGLGYQFNRRHGIDLSYFDLKRSAEQTLIRDVEFGGDRFDRQAMIESSFDIEIWRLSYAYAFLDRPRHRATAQIGMHFARLDASLNRATGARRASASADAPLPVIGIGYAYRISPRWMLDLRGQIFRLRIDEIDGSIDNFSAAVAVAPLRTINLFAGYNYYRIDADITKRLWNGQAKVDFKGPWLGVTVGFGGDLSGGR